MFSWTESSEKEFSVEPKKFSLLDVDAELIVWLPEVYSA